MKAEILQWGVRHCAMLILKKKFLGMYLGVVLQYLPRKFLGSKIEISEIQAILKMGCSDLGS